jgi:NhaP-type Na+/H+ or K+/H+ antiporter
VFGTSEVSLVWLIIFAAILGWLVGIVTSIVIRHSTRRR